MMLIIDEKMTMIDKEMHKQINERLFTMMKSQIFTHKKRNNLGGGLFALKDQ